MTLSVVTVPHDHSKQDSTVAFPKQGAHNGGADRPAGNNGRPYRLAVLLLALLLGVLPFLGSL